MIQVQISISMVDNRIDIALLSREDVTDEEVKIAMFIEKFNIDALRAGGLKITEIVVTPNEEPR